MEKNWNAFNGMVGVQLKKLAADAAAAEQGRLTTGWERNATQGTGILSQF